MKSPNYKGLRGKEKDMYGKISVLPTTTGAAIIPFAGNNKVLLFTAIGLIAVGLAIFTVSTVLAKKAK